MKLNEHREAVFLRLLAVLILLTIIPPAALGYVIYNISRSSHLEQTSVLLRSLAADRELATRLIMERRLDALAHIAENREITRLAAGLVAASPLKNEALERLTGQSPFLVGLALVDTNTGAHVRAGDFPQDIARLSWPDDLPHRPALRSVTLPGGRKAHLLSKPVPGARAGVVLLGLGSLTLFNDLYSDRSMLGETGESFLADSSGAPITDLRYLGHTGPDHKVDAEAMTDCLAGNKKDYAVTPDYVDEPTAMSYRPVEGYGGCVMVHMRASEVMAPVNTIRNMAGAIAAAVVLTAALMSFLVVKKLLRMEKIRSGLEGELARHAGQLEKMVSERTSQLENEVSSRIEAQRLLLESKVFMENIVHSVHDVISAVRVTPEGGFRFMWWNANGERLTGIPSSKADGLTLTGVFGHETGERLSRYHSDCVQNGVVHYEETIHTPAGPRVFLTTLVPVKDPSGRTAEIISSAMDITERKQLETEMIKTQKLESLGVLAGGIAHDFNNFLAVISLNVSMLKSESSLSEEAREMLCAVETSSAMAAKLTNQLLTFSKGGKPVKKTVEVACLLRDVAALAARRTDSILRLDIGEGLYNIEADPGQIAQAISNMLINAEQAMDGGGIAVLAAHNVEVNGTGSGLALSPGNYVKITIKDSGTGISEKDMPRIFDPYFSTKKNGSGLGLSSAYSIVKGHDGHISVRSSPGECTVFEILLPGTSMQAPAEEKKEHFTLTSSSGRVLVMDDDGLVRESVCRVLEALGYTPAACPEGGEAVLQYGKAMEQGRPFDAVILDLTVPGGMGGQDALAGILALDRSARVFVSSGYSDDSVIADHKSHGFCGVLRKPYGIQELDKKLRAVLKSEL